MVPAALVLWAALEWLAPPLAELHPDTAYPFYPEISWLRVHPEPLETVRYALAVAVPAGLAGVVLWLGSTRPSRRPPLAAVVGVQLALIAFAVWALLKQRQVAPGESFVFPFEPLLLSAPVLVAAPLIGLVLTALALCWDRPRLSAARELVARLRRLPDWAALAVVGALTALWLLPGVITDANLAAGGVIPAGHVPLQFNELLAASNGRTPLVDYVPWYGALLPIALAPVFPLFDHSITSFTVTMSLLSGVALVAVYLALAQVTRGAWTALALYLPFLALALRPWAAEGAAWEFNANYFAVMPMRYLGPLLVLWLCARHLRRGSPPLWLLFAVAGLAAINNTDFGLACLVALVAALVLGGDREQPLGRRVRAQAPQAAAGLLGAVAVSLAVLAARSGELPDPALFGYVGRLASRGFSMAPMPTWGLHWVLYLTYAGALGCAAVRYATRASDRTLTGMLAFAAVFGFASGSYFAGRSSPWQLWLLFPAWGLALALLAWTAWLALRSRQGDREALARTIVACTAAFAGFGLMVAAIERFPAPWEQAKRIGASGPSPYDHLDQQRFIESRTEPGERVLILGAELEHRIAERAGVENVSPWFGTLALLSPEETELALEQLEREGGRRAFLNIVQPFVDVEGLSERIGAALRERGFEVVGRDPASGTVEWERRER